MQGLTKFVECQYISMDELKQVCFNLKDSINELDTFTRTLGEFLEKVKVENTLDE